MTCKDCKHWGRLAYLSKGEARAFCNVSWGYTGSGHHCRSFYQITTEPRALGLSKWWLIPGHKFEQAAIVHDCQYDLLKPGDSTVHIDKIFLNNCLRLSKNWRDKAQAYLFYGIIRAYGASRV